MSAADLSTEYCVIPEEAYALIRDGQGVDFESIIGLTPDEFAADTLSPSRAEANADLVQRFTSLDQKQVLEIGAGAGVNLALWSKKFGIEGWAVEPEGDGFHAAADAARAVFAANGVSDDRLINATGEDLPFEDNRFEVVFSINVLEHTEIPARVIAEALRVTKPGGTIVLNCPNYLSVYDGHYNAFHPPVIVPGLFPAWVKYVLREDPTFAKTIRTEINAIWARRVLGRLKPHQSFEIVTLGQDLFRERMKTADVQSMHGMSTVRRAVAMGQKLGVLRVLAEAMILAQAWTPLVIVLRKGG